MNIMWRLLAGLVAAMLALTSQADAAPAGPAPAPGGPVAQAQEMIQGARRDMMENPAMAERRARDFSATMRVAAPSREHAIATAKALWVMGEAAVRQKQRDRGKTLLDRAHRLATSTGDRQTIADVNVSLASLEETMGRPGAAVRKYQAAYAAFQALGNRRSQSITLQHLGGLYVNANDPVRGARYIRQASMVYREEPLLLTTIQSTLGNIYRGIGRDDIAEREYARGADMARAADLPTLEVQLVNNRVRALIAMGRIKEAVAYNRRSQALVANGVKPSKTYLATQAIIALARGDREGARRQADQVEAMLAGEDKKLADQDLHTLLYDAYKSIGDPSAALEHLETATDVQNSQTKETLSSQNALLGARFDYANQDLKITQLKAERMRQSVAEERSTMAWMTGTGAIVLLAMAIGLNASRRSRKRIKAINRTLEQTNSDLKAALEEVVLRERAERMAIQLSEHDILTGLPNRRHLMGSLMRGIFEEGDTPVPVAIMLLDLDRFKPINDIHGHEIGDMLLVEVANRLKAKCANRRAKAIRLGGDEFVVVCALEGEDDGTAIAADLIKQINKPFDIEGRRLSVGVSIGVSVHDRDGTEVSDLLRKADISMYEAKRQGRNAFRFFDEQMDIRLRARAQTEADLHLAVQEEMIDVQYQPIHNFATGRTASFEALARWTHPLRGAVSPEEFIPIAEDIGLIARITDIVLRQACRTAREWPSDVSVSVNLSPMLLGDEWIAPRIHGILAEEGLPPHRLIIEITENAVISDVKHAAEVIASLRDSGIRVALDDFGKGHSSLSQLHELAFDYLKLDCSFVRTLDNPHSMKISAAVSGMAKAMEIPVTAEGIETVEIAHTLEAMGFTNGQGYLYGRPMAAPQARTMAWSADGPQEAQGGQQAA